MMKRLLIATFISLSAYAQGQNYVLYGMTSAGGSYGNGVLFSYNITSGTYNVMVNLNSPVTGARSYCTLKVDPGNGLLYGVTTAGGASNLGTIFSYNPKLNRDSLLVSFNGTDGSSPLSGSMAYYNNMFYGMTYSGGTSGNGNIFSFNPTTGKDSLLVSFTNSPKEFNPYGIQLTPCASTGLLYGTTYAGGTVDSGTLFQYNPITGKDSVIINLNNITGGQPWEGGLTYYPVNGLYYGIMHSGGAMDMGTIYSFDPVTNQFNVLASFNHADGKYPAGSFLYDSVDGRLYGMANGGGASGMGLIFNFDPTNDSINILYQFSGSDGANPDGDIILGPGGKLYGLTQIGGSSNNGVIFSYDPMTGTESVLQNFNGGNGASPYGSLTMLQGNNFIAGNVYIDINHDCRFDSGDVNVNNVTLKILQNNTLQGIAVTNYAGQYSFPYATAGLQYRVELDSAANNFYSVTCPAMGYDTCTAPCDTCNLGINCNGGFDLTGVVDFWVCGSKYAPFTANISACIFNNLCQPVNGTMELVIDTAIHNIIPISEDSTATVSGDTLKWNFDSISPYKAQDLCVYLLGTVDSVPFGDSISIKLIVLPIAGDSVPGNNIITYWVKIDSSVYNHCVGSPYDPNKKSVMPEGAISATQKLTYSIEFQNTGTAPARNVVLMDTLSPLLDITTVHIISNSSPMTTEILSNHVLRFSFYGINLPDTNMSKTASIGDLVYSIMPLNTDIGGDTIRNKAAIFFDYNPPVITNTTVTPIKQNIITTVKNVKATENVLFFPNPFANSTNILFSKAGKHYLEIDDLTGRMIELIECTGSQYILERYNLLSGMYFARVYDNNHQYISTSKLIVQ